MQRDAEVLAAVAGYRYSIDLESYVSRDRRRIVSMLFAEATYRDALRDRLAAPALPDGQWDFCFMTGPSDGMKREILAKLGVELPPAPLPSLEGTVLGAGLLLLWRPLTVPQPGDVMVIFFRPEKGGEVGHSREVWEGQVPLPWMAGWIPITRGRFSRATFDALIAGMPGAVVQEEAEPASQGQV